MTRINVIVIVIVILIHLIMIKCDGEVSSLSISSVPSICFDVSATYKDKIILNEVKGCMFRGRLHAIIGPSGSGKTTLLNILAGQISSNKLKITGDLIDNNPIYPSIFVQQNDILFPCLTVKETLDVAVSLRGDRSRSKDSVDRLINSLGLKKVMTGKVGDAKTRGISGGEKKRLSIGNELISCSSDVTFDESSSSSTSSNLFIYLDEPTSGKNFIYII
jgi:ABC-type multidrug transport system ATPase subunit